MGPMKLSGTKPFTLLTSCLHSSSETWTWKKREENTKCPKNSQGKLAKMKPLLFPLTFTIKKTSSCVYFLGPGGPWFENHLVSSKLNVNKPHTSSDNCEAMNPFHDKDPSLKQLPGVKLLLGAPNQQMWPKISIYYKEKYF